MEVKKKSIYPEKKSVPAVKTSVFKEKEHFWQQDISPKTLIKWFYDANPFYLISTCLVLYAQTVIFNTSNLDLNTAVSIGIIAGFTLLLMGTAVLLSRVAKVWSDLRSIVMIITMLLLVLSVSLDRKIIDGWQTGLLWQSGCLLLAVGISWTIYRELKIKLDKIFISIFCALLGLFYLYPAFPAFLVNESGGDPVPAIRAVMLFPVLFSIFSLFLIPAARQGKAAIKENPSPWNWPYCPWSIYVILWLGAAFRTYLLTISFYGGSGVGPYSKLETGFDFYMLIPMMLTACVLWVEYGIAQRKQWVQNVALAGPALFFLMSIPFLDTPRPYYLFLESVLGKNGSPFIFSIGATVLFYGYAIIRRIRYTEISFAIVLLLASLAEARLGMLQTIGIPSWVSVVVLIPVLSIIAGLRRNAISNILCFSGIMLVLLVYFHGTWFTAYNAVIPTTISLVAVMAIINIYRGATVEVLQWLTVIILPPLCVLALYDKSNAMPWYLTGAYILFLTGLAGIQAFVFKCRKFIASQGAILLVLLVFGCQSGLRAINAIHFRGFKTIMWALIFFMLAFTLSMLKGGVPQKLCRRYISHKNKD